LPGLADQQVTIRLELAKTLARLGDRDGAALLLPT
jgi:hypothetical protein